MREEPLFQGQSASLSTVPPPRPRLQHTCNMPFARMQPYCANLIIHKVTYSLATYPPHLSIWANGLLASFVSQLQCAYHHWQHHPHHEPNRDEHKRLPLPFPGCACMYRIVTYGDECQWWDKIVVILPKYNRAWIQRSTSTPIFKPSCPYPINALHVVWANIHETYGIATPSSSAIIMLLAHCITPYHHHHLSMLQ